MIAARGFDCAAAGGEEAVCFESELIAAVEVENEAERARFAGCSGVALDAAAALTASSALRLLEFAESASGRCARAIAAIKSLQTSAVSGNYMQTRAAHVSHSTERCAKRLQTSGVASQT